MCIISGPVVTVASTKIFAIPSKDRKRQLTVYKNEVDTKNYNAMCLPVPNPHTVQFEKVSNNIFKQCSMSFSSRILKGITRNSGMYEYHSLSIQKPLPILSHGSYDVVLVPSMNDIERIPTSFTTLTNEVIQFLRTSYPENFGIVLCKLRQGNMNYEPFAYSHDIQQNGKLFFPTKHFHTHDKMNVNQLNGDGGWQSSFGSSLLGDNLLASSLTLPDSLQNVTIADDWDHEIYSAETPIAYHESRTKGMKQTNEIDWSEIPTDFQLGNSTILRCKDVAGRYANVDIQMPIEVV
jgi:hypothetical protein